MTTRRVRGEGQHNVTADPAAGSARKKRRSARASARSARIGVFALILGGVLAPGDTEGYRFSTDGRTDWQAVPVEYAQRWSAEVWGAGEELVWELAPDPDWEVVFEGPAEVFPIVGRMLGVWSEISTADISWKAELGSDDIDQEMRMLDGVNSVFVDRTFDYAQAYAGVQEKYSQVSGRFEIVECDVGFAKESRACRTTWSPRLWTAWSRTFAETDSCKFSSMNSVTVSVSPTQVRFQSPDAGRQSGRPGESCTPVIRPCHTVTIRWPSASRKA